MFDITPAVHCSFLTQELHFRTCDTRDAGMLDAKTSLPYHALSPKRIPDEFIACKVRSADARADAKNNLVEIIKTNRRIHWQHVVPNRLRHSRTNRLHESHPQIPQTERVPTVGATKLRRISKTNHITQNWIDWTSRIRTKTYKLVTLEAMYTLLCRLQDL